MEDSLILIARLGRSVGLKGAMKLHRIGDFDEIFTKGLEFFIAKENSTILESSRSVRLKSFQSGRVEFDEISSVDDAKRVTNFYLFAKVSDTRRLCKLKEDEHFWFDLVGFEVYEGDSLGAVSDVLRIGTQDYLEVSSPDSKKPFLIPYIDHFIVSVDKEARVIYTSNAIHLR